MPFNEFKQPRFGVIKHQDIVQNEFVHLTEEDCYEAIIKVLNKYSYLIEPQLPFLQIRADSTYRSALYTLLIEVGNSSDGDIFVYDEETNKLLIEHDCGYNDLSWIPIRPFLEYRRHEVFPMICCLLGNIAEYVSCGQEPYRESEGEMAEDRVMYEDDIGERGYYMEKLRQDKLYSHYISLFKSCKDDFTHEELLDSVKDIPALKEFFKDGVDFIKNPSYAWNYNGYIDEDSDYRPIDANTIFNLCWGFESNIDEAIVESINCISNEAGYMNVAYKTDIEEDSTHESLEKFNLLNKLFTKNYELYT